MTDEREPRPASPFDDIDRELLGPAAGYLDGDLQATIDVSLAESIDGCERQVTIRRRVPCGVCHGTRCDPAVRAETCAACDGSGKRVREHGVLRLTTDCKACDGRGRTTDRPCAACERGAVWREEDFVVTLPPGVRDGATRRVPGLGNLRPEGGGSGAAIFDIRVAMPPGLSRDGDHLRATLRLRAGELAAGGDFKVAAARGEATVTVPPNAHDGQAVVVRGGGFPIESPDAAEGLRPDASARGDLVVTLRNADLPDLRPRPVWPTIAVALALLTALAAMLLPRL